MRAGANEPYAPSGRQRELSARPRSWRSLLLCSLSLSVALWTGLSVAPARGVTPTQTQQSVALAAKLDAVVRHFSQDGVAKCEEMLVAVVTVPPDVGNVTITMTEKVGSSPAQRVTIPGLTLLDTINTQLKNGETLAYGDLSYTVHGDNQAYGLGYGGGPGDCGPNPFSDIKATGVKTEAEIVGTVSDACGHGVAGVTVSASGPGGGSATTRANGSYVLDVTPNSYTVHASSPGVAIDPHTAAVDAPGVADFSEQACGELSVVDVAASATDLTADVRVRLDDKRANASGCDPNATYKFDDPALESVKTTGPCRFTLTFQSPATGIFHVSLRATEQSGKVVPLTVDQYGQSVNGRFTVIIDSCSRPSQDVSDVEALLNPTDSTCDVMVGDWDSDSAHLANAVVAADESSRDMVLKVQPTSTIDASDWHGQTPSASPNTGWAATGTDLPPLIARTGRARVGPGGAVALVDRLSIPGIPNEWDGAGVRPSAKQLKAVPPATVITAHGAWYTPNGVLRVPTGDQIVVYVPIGTSMGNDLGVDIDTGNLHGADLTYRHVYTSGQLIPNFTFVHYPGVTGTHVLNPTTPTTLNELLASHKGTIWISACADLLVPPGETITQALASVPLYTPGSATVGTTTATLTRQGLLAP